MNAMVITNNFLLGYKSNPPDETLIPGTIIGQGTVVRQVVDPVRESTTITLLNGQYQTNS